MARTGANIHDIVICSLLGSFWLPSLVKSVTANPSHYCCGRHCMHSHCMHSISVAAKVNILQTVCTHTCMYTDTPQAACACTLSCMQPVMYAGSTESLVNKYSILKCIVDQECGWCR